MCIDDRRTAAPATDDADVVRVRPSSCLLFIRFSPSYDHLERPSASRWYVGQSCSRIDGCCGSCANKNMHKSSIDPGTLRLVDLRTTACQSIRNGPSHLCRLARDFWRTTVQISLQEISVLIKEILDVVEDYCWKCFQLPDLVEKVNWLGVWGRGFAPLLNLENFEKWNPFYLVFMQYKCENNRIEQIHEISLTSNLGWIGYANISNR